MSYKSLTFGVVSGYSVRYFCGSPLANTMAATLYLANDESRHPAVNRGSPPLPASFISSFVNEIVKSINAASGHPLPAEKGVIAQLKRVDLLHIGFHFAQKAQRQPYLCIGDRRG